MTKQEVQALKVGDTVGYDSPYRVQANGKPMFRYDVGIVVSLTWKYVHVLWIAYASDLSQQIDTEDGRLGSIDRTRDQKEFLALDAYEG